MSDLGWYGRTSYDRRQNEELDNLAGQLSYQREEARRLKATLSRVQGGLEQRLGRLATAFDAFVELSDLREELRVFEPAATARRRARRVVLQLRTADTVPDGLTPPPPGDSAPEAFGYWLPGALAGLVARRGARLRRPRRSWRRPGRATPPVRTSSCAWRYC